MDRTKIIGGLTLLLALAGGSCSKGAQALRVGSKNFTEQVVLGEIIAQHLEQRLHRPVERRLNLGGTLLAHQALRSREIDMYPEYSGTALAAILKTSAENDAAGVLARVRAEYLRDFQVEWLDPLGVDNSFAMVVAGAEARAKKLENLTDASKIAEGWLLGVGYEFEQRADGLAALNKAYGIKWKPGTKSMDLGLLYKALEQGQVTMIAANATDGMLSKMDLKVLSDDKHAFPPYELCVAVRQDSMRETAGLREALVELSGKFTNQRMQELNFQVDGEHRPVAQVAAGFLKQVGLE